MNNKKPMLALAVTLPIILFFVAKWGTRWRPIAIGRVDGANSIDGISNRYLSISGVLFDLKTGVQTKMSAPSGAAADYIWSVETHGRPQLTLIKDSTALIYPIPRFSKRNDFTNYGGLIASTFVSPERNCVQLLLRNRYCQWNLRSRQLEREFQMPIIYGASCAFSRDGEILVEAGCYAVATFSTRTGRTLTYRPGNPKLKFGMATFGISAQGSYIMADNPDGDWDVEETHTGRILWQFAPDGVPVFSSDETFTVLPLHDKGLWEIRETKTGHLIHTLKSTPGIPKDYVCALSPDSSTLYYVANGVLYRQRAR